MKRMIIMVGLPRSGKSTWRQENASECVTVSCDEIRQIVYGHRFYADGEPFVWATRDTLLKILMKQGVDIVIDDTNTTIAARNKLMALANKFEYEVTAVVIHTTDDICISRAVYTKQEDLIPVIDRMKKQWEEPTKTEGFESIIHVEGK